MKKAVLLGLLLLSGCISREEIDANDDARCSSYGLKYGTPEYAQCRMGVDQQRQAAIAQVGANIQAQTAQQNQLLLQSRPRPQVNCTTVPMGGGTSSTNCQ